MVTTGSPSPILVVEHEPDASLGRFAPWLEQAGCRTHLCRAGAGDPVPADLSGFGGLIVLGGSPAAWDDESAPWLPATRALIRRAVAEHLPTLGLCLGGQLLALACGGRVERGGPGWEIGVGAVRPLPAAARDLLFGYLPQDGLPAAQWHLDAVTELPEDAELLVTGSPYPVQGFRVGERAWGVQFHPEVTAADYCTWGDVAPPDGVDVPDAYRQMRIADTDLADAWRPLALAFAALVDRP